MRFWLAFASTILVLGAPAVRAQSPDAPKSAGDLRKPQEQNAKLFRELSQGLLRLAQKLERSEKQEDQDRAKTIRAALKVAEEAGVDNQFQKLVAGLGKGETGLQDFTRLRGQDAELSKTLQEIVNILMTDDEAAKLKQEIARLTEVLKEVKDLKRRQEILRALTELQKGDPGKLAEAQNDLARQTADLSKRLGSEAGEAGKPKPDPKADLKPEGKPGDQSAEKKTPDADAKPGDKPDASGDKKPADGGDKKPSDAKPSDGKPGDKPMGGDSKPMGGDAKPGEAGKPEEKPSAAKPGDKPDAGKPEAGKPEDKAATPKPAEPPAAPPKGDAKPAGKEQSNARDAGTPPPPPSDGKPSDPQQGGSPSDGGPSSPKQSKPKETPGRKSIEEAYPNQKQAETDLKKNDRPAAGKNESKAIEDLAKAIEELEKRLKQLRDEELERLLAGLEARCNRMLGMQIEVYETTRGIHATVVKAGNVKSNAEVQKAQVAATKENDIITEADRTMRIMEEEGSAVAFARVLEEVRGDMAMIQKRLEGAVVDTDTQTIEENVIAMLKDMVAALKKAQDDLKDKDKKDDDDGDGGGKGNRNLINKLAELRLIRALQQHVNQRTAMHGNKSPSEQANDPLIQGELRQLAARQAKLQDMVFKLATGANR